jgi:flagellar M-ring protein FliF
VNEIVAMARSFGIARLSVIIGAAIGVALVIGLMALRVSEPSLTPLYSGLDPRDGEELLTRLERDGVKYQVREEAGRMTVLAAAGDAARLKLALASDGFVVRGGGVGYEIFDEQDALGATSFQQNINRLRALEGELARTIATIDGVRSARVHLVLPERELFSRERQPATASIVVDAPSGLDKKSVRAIVNLAASAAPGLAPSRVTLLDSRGELLASGQDGADPLAGSGGVDERIAATEARLRRTVEDIVGRVVGPENLRVQVAADLDFSRVTETANIIDPDSQTVLSATSVEDSSNSNEPALTRGVTVANQLPEAQLVDPLAAAAATNAARRTEETTNYEMTRTVRNEVREIGGVKRLSVAVALNLPTTTDATGAALPAPRSTAELERIAALVRSAVGYNPARGDQVEIVEMPFRSPAAAEPAAAGSTASPAAPFRADQVIRAAEIAALGLVAFAIGFFVLRPLLRPQTPGASVASGPESLLAPAGQTALPSPGAESLIDLAQVDGKVRASSVKRVAEVVKSHTDESAGILKNWIRQTS